MPRAVLFGYDGVLVDQSGLREEILGRVLAEEGLPALPESFAVNPPRAPYERWLAEILEGRQAAAGPAMAARLMARARAAYRENLQETGPRWLPGATELVERIARNGIQLALVAAAPGDEVERTLRAGGLAAAFKVVVTGADLLDPANQLSGHRLALALLNSQPPLPERLIHPHEVAAVEAIASGARAAAEAGLVVIRIGSCGSEDAYADHRAGALAEIDPAWLGAG